MTTLLTQSGITRDLVKEAVLGALAGGTAKILGKTTASAIRHPGVAFNTAFNTAATAAGAETLGEAVQKGKELGLQATR